MTIASGLVREVVESYFWYIQRAISATRTAVVKIIWIEIAYKSGIILQEINYRNPFISLSGRIADSTVRECGLSSAHSLGVRSTLRTLTKVGTPRITFAISPTCAFISGGLIFLGRDAKVRLIPNVGELCAEVG